MAKESAGLLAYRIREGRLEFLLVHPGGPFWKNKDHGAWSIAKGEIQTGEEPLAAAIREFGEELGVHPEGDFIALTPVRQRSGKVVRAWGWTGDFNPSAIQSNTFQLEWPPRSGRVQEFPEVDRAAWFGLEESLVRINPGQRPLLEELQNRMTQKRHQ